LIADPLILKGDWHEQFCEHVSTLCLGVTIGVDSGIY